MKKIFFFFSAVVVSLSTLAGTFNIHINNQTGWDATALYAWADSRPDVLGGWPGVQHTTTKQVGDINYLVYTIDESVLPANFIFNNNGGDKQLSDFYISEARDYFLVTTAAGALKEEGAAAPTFDYYIYVNDLTSWASLKAYAYNDGNTAIMGGWPGKPADDAKVVNGVTYKMFGVNASHVPCNVIFNNGEGTQLNDFYMAEPRDYYLNVAVTGVTEGEAIEPEIETYHLYVNDKTGWAEFDLYAWGTYEAFGGWPGVAAPQQETINGVTYKVYDFQVVKGGSIELHLIFHNNVGEGVEGDKRQLFDITEARDYYLTVSNTTVTEGQTTGLINVADGLKNGKMIQNGQLYIMRDGKVYNILGAVVNM